MYLKKYVILKCIWLVNMEILDMDMGTYLTCQSVSLIVTDFLLFQTVIILSALVVSLNMFVTHTVLSSCSEVLS